MKAVIVTGATSGIGFSICKTLLGGGYSVIGTGRVMEKCEAAEAALRKTFPDGDIRYLCGDLMRQREVVRIADEARHIAEECFEGRLYALINNAGCARSSYMTTEEGYEQQFALNYLAGFLLTYELMPVIRRSNAYVIFTSSASHKRMRVNWDDIMYQRRYRPLYAYKQSKLCNMLLAYALREMGVWSCGVDPGLVATDIGNKDTGGIVDFIWRFRKKHGVPPEKPAEIYRYLCDNGISGLYYGFGGKELRVNGEVNGVNAKRLYELSKKLCGKEGDYESIHNGSVRRTGQGDGGGMCGKGI